MCLPVRWLDRINRCAAVRAGQFVIGLVLAGAVVPSVALVRVARWLNTLGGPLCFYALIGNGTTVLTRTGHVPSAASYPS